MPENLFWGWIKGKYEIKKNAYICLKANVLKIERNNFLNYISCVVYSFYNAAHMRKKARIIICCNSKKSWNSLKKYQINMLIK